jgi:hypothetical protein
MQVRHNGLGHSQFSHLSDSELSAQKADVGELLNSGICRLGRQCWEHMGPQHRDQVLLC